MFLTRNVNLTGPDHDDALITWLTSQNGITAARMNGNIITLTYDPQIITYASLVALFRGRGIEPAPGLVTRWKIALFDIMDRNLADNATLPFGMDVELQRIYTRLTMNTPLKPEVHGRS